MLLSKSLKNVDLKTYRIYDHIQSNSFSKVRQGPCCVTVTYFVAYVSYHSGKKCKMQGFKYLKKAVNNISRAVDVPGNACALSVSFTACVGRLHTSAKYNGWS